MRVTHPLELVPPAQGDLELQETKTASRRHLRVSVVEGNSLLRVVTIGLLATWGITPALAADGSEAVLLCGLS